MKDVPVTYDKNVLVGFDKSDDAGVYKISEDTALVQTLDFITPIVDDPYIFGKICAANSLSDVYSMGGVPITAMNIVAFPVKKFSLDILSKILKGGLDVLNTAGVQLLGGHSVEDNELKYGLSVTGKVHPDKIFRNNGIAHGDAIVLTKPLGTGIIATALKADTADESIIKPFIKSMTSLNNIAAEIMKKYNVHACTDVTGFGLAGHLKEMLSDDLLEITIHTDNLPILPGVKDSAEAGMLPGGLYRNKDFVSNLCSVGSSVPVHLSDVIFDPQTSGGLLIGLPEKDADSLVDELHEKGLNDSRKIAVVRSSKKQKIEVV